MKITTKKLATGRFQVFRDGRPTQYEILNGDVGCSGRGRNTYGVQNLETSEIRWIGTLAKCKKTVELWIGRPLS